MATKGVYGTLTGKLDGLSATGPATLRHSRHAHWDESHAQFFASPTGPFEGEPEVHDKPTSDQHFRETREIKFKDPRGIAEPLTSYREHYPGHPVDSRAAAEAPDTRQLPFNADTTYHAEFPWKDPKARVDGSIVGGYSPSSAPFMGKTTYSTYHTGFPVDPKPSRPLLQPSGDTVDPQSFLDDTHKSTYQVYHVPHPVEPRPGPQRGTARPPLPWLAEATTTADEYPAKAVAPLKAVGGPPVISAPFAGESEYQSEFVPKEARPFLPHLTGVLGQEGMLLPGPRRSLGVQFWSRGEPDHNYIMIPYNVPAPCSATQVFTTVHDNQETGAIIIHYGEDHRTHDTQVLGQMDLTGIPPAPRDVPRIQVKFTLSADLRLKVEVTDLDTQRQKEWLQRGGVVLKREGTTKLGVAPDLLATQTMCHESQ